MLRAIALAGLVGSLISSQALAQFPGGPGGGLPGLGGSSQLSFAKLFGEHKAFTADSTIETIGGSQESGMTLPAKITFLEGKSRMDVDLSRSKGPQLPAGMAEQLKTMGMGEMTLLSEEGTNATFLVYPGLKAYLAMTIPDAKTPDMNKIKMESTKLGEETIESHPTVKNKVLLTNPDGKQNNATVWNATDLKNFPIRIETGDKTNQVRMSFRNVKFDRPNAQQFEPPANFSRHENIQSLMGEAMKRLLGGAQPEK